MEKAFGSAVTEEARDKIIQRIVDRSRARCPVLELNDCQKEALRRAPFLLLLLKTMMEEIMLSAINVTYPPSQI